MGTLVTHSYVAYATYVFSGLGKAPGPTKSRQLLECGCPLPLWFFRSVSKYRASNLDKAAEDSRTPRRWREVPSHRCVPPHAKHVLCYIIRAATRKSPPPAHRRPSGGLKVPDAEEPCRISGRSNNPVARGRDIDRIRCSGIRIIEIRAHHIGRAEQLKCRRRVIFEPGEVDLRIVANLDDVRNLDARRQTYHAHVVINDQAAAAAADRVKRIIVTKHDVPVRKRCPVAIGEDDRIVNF